ncbi:TetR/AcrR family transcriptional regulator [Rhizobium sp. P40RR-XXII]|uniref:TetR/AcrR family transcriptional regulator n=1 Tax=Rhizobium sp. P40RR-XXII TaxID=2726739 RepID=UPI0014571BEB|nr:TetR/AcrR family transcriptional regulator [Rhizobium sp. P40RR-XXII]NLS17527.1 TetR/AcrR family transcriptional regulator [Rhizobium sp. P40RR-XXII]
MKANERSLARREPKQERSRHSVEAILEAVQRVVNRHGAKAITTNRIAEAAGVSIGSLYQYFPDKQAIFAALHDRHVDDVRRVMTRAIADCATASFKDFTRELMEGLADVHAKDADLHDIIATAVPEGAPGFKSALQATLGKVISPSRQERYTPEATQRILFILPHLMEALAHGAADRRLSVISRHDAKGEAIRTVLAYVNSCENGRLSF